MNKGLSEKFDIIVVGGGLAGLSLSCLLAQNKALSIACIDLAPAKPPESDLRTTAISYGSSQILERAGIWPRMRGKTSAINDIRILDGHSSTLLNFLNTEVEDRSFGWIVDNTELRTAMIEELNTHKNVTHICETRITDFENNDTHITVHTTNKSAKETTLEASLVLGADGRNSFTRQWMGVPTRQWSYNQRAVICNVAHENPHENVAVEHFWPEGPLAILPMADDTKTGEHRSSLVFTEHGPQSKSLMKLSDKEFEIILNERFPESYGHVHMLNKRVAYPLGLVHAADYIAPRMALIADAAHGIHPIAGQGLNLGFRDIAEIANLIAGAVEKDEDFASPELLETYQRRRRPDNMAMVAVTDGLNRLFSNNIPPVRLLRRVGLKAVSKLKPAKNFFMKQAMGDR